MAPFLIFEKVILRKNEVDGVGASLDTSASARRARFHRLGQEASG
jgi:hypothetical protein